MVKGAKGNRRDPIGLSQALSQNGVPFVCIVPDWQEEEVGAFAGEGRKGGVLSEEGFGEVASLEEGGVKVGGPVYMGLEVGGGGGLEQGGRAKGDELAYGSDGGGEGRGS